MHTFPPSQFFPSGAAHVHPLHYSLQMNEWQWSCDFQIIQKKLKSIGNNNIENPELNIFFIRFLHKITSMCRLFRTWMKTEWMGVVYSEHNFLFCYFWVLIALLMMQICWHVPLVLCIPLSHPFTSTLNC